MIRTLNWAYRLFPSPRQERILFNVMLPIGDTLFTTPAVRAVRRRFPRAHIAALTFPTNAGILYANEDIDEIILHPTGQTFTPWAYVRFLWRMRQKHFTMAIEFRPYVWWLSVACGIVRRLSFDIPVYQWFFPFSPRPWKRRHAIANYASVIDLLGVPVDASRLVVRTTNQDRAALTDFLAAQGVGRGERLVVLHPGGEGFRGMKRWDSARFALLGDRLAERHDARIVIIGGRDELPLAQTVAETMKCQALVLNGRVTLGQSIALLERCYLFVGDDSAPLHMAGSLDVPTVGVFGPTNVVNYHPVGPYVEIARSDLVCSPCFFFVGSAPVWAGSRCRVPTCLHALAVETVLAAADRAISKKACD